MISAKPLRVLVLAGGCCSLRGERSLIEEAVGRDATLVDTGRICTIVAAVRRHWWAESAALGRFLPIGARCAVAQ